MRWDIFCQIVDNYGDAGICWRLARSLTSLHGQEVRIFCDDLPTLNLLARGCSVEIRDKIKTESWEASFENARHPVEPPDVVIEAFGCDLPERYLAGLLIAPKKPVIINLEYLSAEPWVLDFHAKASPQAHGIPKYFFFPGFQEAAGGILLDPIPIEQNIAASNIPKSLLGTWEKLRPGTKRISVFCYPGFPLRKWIEDLGAVGEPIDVILTHGHAELLKLGSTESLELAPGIQLLSIPFVSQDEYDWLLAQCDLNIVRGEDSFIRAQLVGKPFIWHIYPQDDQAHQVKLAAFLDLYLASADTSLQNVCRNAMNWALPHTWFSELDSWTLHAKAWQVGLLEKQGDGGLAERLVRFVS